MNYLENLNELPNIIKNDENLWNLFTKKDEYKITRTDKYGRISYKKSNNENILNPIVSEYLIKNDYQTEYMDNKKFAIFLSHDIDDVYPSFRHLIRSFGPYPIHKQKLGFLKFIRAYYEKKNPYKNFKEIIRLEKKYDAKSTFFFLATEKDVYGNKYKLDNIQDEISYILEQNCEIGLHTSFYAYNNIKKIKSEKKKLEETTGKKIVGVRNHIYRFNLPDTWKLLFKAGFDYDSTFGYHDMIGFRNGMCHPFFPYDVNENKIIPILEIPPCIVDISLFSYMKLNAGKSWIIIKKLIDNVEKLGGVISILWHNWTYSYPVSYAGLFGREWTKLYEKILDYGYKKNAWLINGKNISDFISY
jgi:peptidoglycan/xylan/chitin deacetylase (PgdA/CDA1 family)